MDGFMKRSRYKDTYILYSACKAVDQLTISSYLEIEARRTLTYLVIKDSTSYVKERLKARRILCGGA